MLRLKKTELSLSAHDEQCQVDCLSILFLDIQDEFQTELLRLYFNFMCTTYMIFVMFFETLRHSILANEATKSALILINNSNTSKLIRNHRNYNDSQKDGSCTTNLCTTPFIPNYRSFWLFQIHSFCYAFIYTLCIQRSQNDLQFGREGDILKKS